MNTHRIKTINQEPDYLITDHGEVISRKFDTRKILKPLQDMQGYHYVNLCTGGKQKAYYIHRLVAEYFVNELIKGMVVNHIDGNKRNNHHTNLEVDTQKHNVQEAIRQKFKGAMSIKCGYNKGREIIITDFKENTEQRIHSLYATAKLLDVTIAAVYNCCTGRQITVKGFGVRYA